MENQIRCKICRGTILLSIFVMVHYPICKDCSEKIKKQPDIPIEQKNNSISRQIFVGVVSASVFSTDSDVSLINRK